MTLEDESRYLNGEGNRGPNVLNAWTHGDLVLVRMLGMVHVEHSSMYQRNEDVWKGFSEQQVADYGREDGIVGYAWIARYTLHFLDAYLKHDAAAMAWLKKTPAENGAPQHFLSASYRPASGPPATLESFRAELGRQGFDHAEGVYAAMRKQSPDFKLDESAVNNWGYELMTDGHLPEAIDIFKLNVKNYPDSGNTYDSLGEAYMKSGQKQLAIDNYKKSLDKDPSNTNARQKLKELGEAPAEPK
jgi:tetratricopeptide (TPR) repeat protein